MQSPIALLSHGSMVIIDKCAKNSVGEFCSPYHFYSHQLLFSVQNVLRPHTGSKETGSWRLSLYDQVRIWRRFFVMELLHLFYSLMWKGLTDWQQHSNRLQQYAGHLAVLGGRVHRDLQYLELYCSHTIQLNFRALLKHSSTEASPSKATVPQPFSWLACLPQQNAVACLLFWFCCISNV